ncbi:Tetraspanin-7, partial [Ooceraea biroi]
LFQYGAFLAVVALLELGAGASVYAYRTNLNEGFDQGLNESMIAYGQEHSISNHIDTMQSTVSIFTVVIHAALIILTGCYNRVVDFINSNIGLVAGTAIGVAFFPLVGIFLACCLASNINKTEYEQVA